MDRKKDSHKGQNGRVMIVGGSAKFYGAPILCGLGAQVSGADLVFPFLPPIHVEAAKAHSLNFIIHQFKTDVLTPSDVRSIVKFSETVDVCVIGPGLGEDTKTQKAVKELLANIEVPTVLDASGLIFTNNLPKTLVMTPHRGEFKKLTGDDPSPKNAQKWAEHFGATIVIKGYQDIIANKEHVAINKTGNAMMTVGGTGDVLSGLIGGLIAQGIEPFEAGKLGTKFIGDAGDEIAKRQSSLSALDLIYEIPKVMHK